MRISSNAGRGSEGSHRGGAGRRLSKSNRASAKDHNRQVIGYITQWDAWKAIEGVVPKAGYTQVNVDFSQYTILNYSFFGVAYDGSLHSGDYRNKKIYEAGAIQEPAPMVDEDVYSSFDMWVLYGELDVLWYISDGSYAYQQGYRNEGSGWKNINTGKTGSFPLSVPKEGGTPGLLKKGKDAGVKVMASIGGWSMSRHFPEIVTDQVKLNRFLDACDTLIGMGFDGIDIDWEFPNARGMNIEQYSEVDYTNFAVLMEKIRERIGKEKLLTAAMSASPALLAGFDWARLDRSMDYFNMMTYDFNGGWSDKAGHNSPLYDYPGQEITNFSVDACARAIKSYGANMQKVNLGGAFYGRGAITQGAAALNGATSKRSEMVDPDGPITTCADYENWPEFDGTPNYSVVLYRASVANGWTEYWDDDAKVPYRTRGHYFVSYDDERSIAEKANYIVNENLAGIIIWQVWGDMLDMTKRVSPIVADKLVSCPDTRCPLVNKINEVFASGGGNQYPVVSLTSPYDGETFEAPSTISLKVDASDPDGQVVKVEYYVNDSLVGTSTTAPFNYSSANIGVGSYVIYARAYDNGGLYTDSTEVTVKVESTTGNLPPVVSITCPAAGASFTAPAAINISVDASDPDGTISKIEVYNSAQKLGDIVGAPPYSLDWQGVAAGNYTLTAKAYDDEGASTVSAAVNIVVSGDGGCGGVPAWNAAKAYNTSGEEVAYNKKVYGQHYPNKGIPPDTQPWVYVRDCDGGHSSLEDLITAEEWNELFPHRYGVEMQEPDGDFFSYSNFLEAYRRMSDIKVQFERRCATNYYRITRINKTTGEEVIIRNDAGFNEAQHADAAIVTQVVDYAAFVSEGSLEARKRELMAFLANIAQETTGGWDTAPDGRYAWGLYFKQEVGYDDASTTGYRDEGNVQYPPAPDKSYHGRGPIQLSWNYNYGQVSEFLYADKNVLLLEPEKVVHDGALAFQTGIWFWMTPQYPKPSCHEVMVPLWQPGTEDAARGLKPGFGATVNIINGGLECGGTTENLKVKHRLGHYKRFTTIAGVSMELDGGDDETKCGCAGMGDFRIDSQECSRIASLRFMKPASGAAVGVTSLAPIAIEVSKSDPNSEITAVQAVINGQVYDSLKFTWTPPAYRQFSAKATATIPGKDPVTTAIAFAVWNTQTLEGCQYINAWNPEAVYQQQGNIVLYDGSLYRNKWYADGTNIPGKGDPWEALGQCEAAIRRPPVR